MVAVTTTIHRTISVQQAFPLGIRARYNVCSLVFGDRLLLNGDKLLLSRVLLPPNVVLPLRVVAVVLKHMELSWPLFWDAEMSSPDIRTIDVR